jgi:hypothetical protein
MPEWHNHAPYGPFKVKVYRQHADGRDEVWRELTFAPGAGLVNDADESERYPLGASLDVVIDATDMRREGWCC